jgi:hypothetical protein
VSLYVHVLCIYSERYVCLLSSIVVVTPLLIAPMRLCDHVLVLGGASIVTNQTKDRISIAGPEGGTP